jgi:hypothetical protein
MSITMSTTTTTHPPEPLTWKQADDDIHVATRAGEYAGFVELDTAGHVVHDNRGTELGSFATLADARRALEGSTQRRPRSFAQTMRRHLNRVRG